MFDTGKFSRMARVSKRTLRYYDSIDLFKPIRVDQNGTRYYSAKQFADLNRILALKELGLTLDQIRRMLQDDVSPEEIRGMLALKRAEAEQKLLEDIQRFRSIEARLQRPDVYLTQGVVLKSVPEQTYLSYRHVVPAPQMVELMQAIVGRVPLLAGRKNVTHYTSIIHQDDFDLEGTLDAEFGFLMPRPAGLTLELSEDVILTERILPAVDTIASVILEGGPTGYPAGFQSVASWCEDTGHQVMGAAREIFLEIPPDGNMAEMVVELQFPVERLISDPQALLSDQL